MTDVADVQHTLSVKAAVIANEKAFADRRVPPQYTNIYRPLGYEQLGLTFSRSFVALGEPLLGILQQIARDSVRQAVHDNPALIGSLIIGEARKGRNYFNS